MDEEYVVYIHDGILLSNKKELNFATCNNVDGTRMYYAKWNKVSQRKINIIWVHLYVEFKKENRWT